MWRDRFARGRVLGAAGAALDLDAAFQVGMEICYFREVMDERAIPFAESVLFADEHLVVADKPHFLQVVPAGRFVRETLLGRLVRRLGNAELAPLHRIDRDTAGLVLFSANPATRAVYQDLFRLRRIEKRYEALAPALPELAFPLTHRSRLVSGEPFFRMPRGKASRTARPASRCWRAATGHGAMRWRRSQVASTSCGCIWRRWARRSSTIRFTRSWDMRR